MELYSAEAESIRKRVEEWVSHQDFELEATFRGGTVDAVTFLAVAQRLRAKGYTSLPQEDRLTVMTPEHIRFELLSLAVIQEYCRSDVMAGKPFTAIIKDRATPESQTDLEDYGVRVKNRRELPMDPSDGKLKELFSTWNVQKKGFRMIRRWSFEGDGVRIDMSTVRSTKKDSRGEFRWQRKFRDQDILKSPPTYEIEVELLQKPDDSTDSAMKRLFRGIGEVLRGMQKNSLLLRDSVKATVLSGYKQLTGTDLFRGPAPRTLLKENFMEERDPTKANIRDGYNVTDKADGLRNLGYVDSKGELFLIDMGLNVYRTGLRRPECRLSLVDGEWITQTKDKKPIQQYLIFDMFYAPDRKDVHSFPFYATSDATGTAIPPEATRYGQIKAWTTLWNKDTGPSIIAAGVTSTTKIHVAVKDFFFGQPGDTSIFRMAAKVLGATRPYYTDGLIFTSNTAQLPDKAAATFYEQFKWKPPKDNTVDFLVTTEKVTGSKTQDKITSAIKPGTGETVNYKTLRLFVGSRTENARDVVLNKRALPPRDRTFYGKRGTDYKPVLFTPKEFPDPMASICNLDIHTDPDTGESYIMTDEDHSAEPIQDHTIVEMAYDPSRPAGWRWIPLRVRMDKTERLQRGTISRTLNSDLVAEDVWNSIYDPISVSMIRTGAEQPTKEELETILSSSNGLNKELSSRRYYDKKMQIEDKSLVHGLREFHNKWIKESILYHVGLSGDGKALLDVACGVAGDLHKWRREGVKFVLGLDYAAKNIMGTEDGAYKRYMESAVNAGGFDHISPMVFAIADSSKPLVDGTAGATEEEKDILRSVFGRVRPQGSVPAFVEEFGASRLKLGADCVSCMFAIHYFFESKATLDGFIKNVSDTLKVGGMFIGCCFDGEKVFNLLQNVGKGEKVSGSEKGATLWTITKEYEEEELPTDDTAVGLPINVDFITIGAGHREYLVPFRLLEDKMKSIGCELLGADDLKKVGMKNSTATFDVSWDMAKKAGKSYPMGDATKQFSFMNRWFVFKRVRQETVATATVALEKATKEMANVGLPGSSASASASALPVGRAKTAKASALAASVAANTEQGQGQEAANILPTRTLPVAPGPAAPQERTYAPGELFQFYPDAAVKDALTIGDKGAARWLAPYSPFPIPDPEDKSVTYPSVEHYLAGMYIKLASNKPELAAAIFGREGTIHQSFLRIRTEETSAGTRPLSEERDQVLLKDEAAQVKNKLKPAGLKSYGIKLDDAAWSVVKDDTLKTAYTYRWNRDARLRKIVEAARNQGKTLLYYTPGVATSNLGGMRSSSDGRISGQNKIGRILMDLAGFPA